jgi:hypothetical protein
MRNAHGHILGKSRWIRMTLDEAMKAGKRVLVCTDAGAYTVEMIDGKRVETPLKKAGGTSILGMRFDDEVVRR